MLFLRFSSLWLFFPGLVALFFVFGLFLLYFFYIESAVSNQLLHVVLCVLFTP